MIRRSDLAKQFELVVKQEIKNFNDSKLSINLAINDLNERLYDFSKTYNHKLEETKALLLSLDSKVEEIGLKIKSNKINFDNQEKKFDKQNIFFTSFHDSILESIFDLKHKFNGISETFGFLANKITENEKDFEEARKQLCQEMYQLKLSFENQIEIAKNEILNTPSDCKANYKEVCKKLDSHNVDVEGIKKESRIHTKNIFIITKNLEHIYTLIDRLKKEVSQ